MHPLGSHIDINGIVFVAHVCKVTFKHLAFPVRSHIQSFRNSDNFSNYSPALSNNPIWEIEYRAQKERKKEDEEERRMATLLALLAHALCSDQFCIHTPLTIDDTCNIVAKLSPSRLALARLKLVLVSTSPPSHPPIPTQCNYV
jgi:hypothetical protein